MRDGRKKWVEKINSISNIYIITFLLLVAIIVLLGFSLYQFSILRSANLQLSKGNDELIEKFNKIIELTSQDDDMKIEIYNKYESTNDENSEDKYLRDEYLENGPISELSAMKLYVEQFDSFKTDWQSLLTFFTILVSIFAVAVPVFNYVIVVKDKLEIYDNIIDKKIIEFEFRQESVMEEFEKNKNDAKSEIIRLSNRTMEFTKDKSNSQQSPEVERKIKEADYEFDSGNYQKAITLLTNIINDDNQSADVYYLRGAAYYELEKYNEAIEDINIAIKKDRDNAEYYYTRGLFYFMLNNYNEALRDLNEAIDKDDKNEKYYNSRAKIYFAMRDYKNAISDVSFAININHNSDEYFLGRAMMYSSMKRYEKALKDINSAIEINPKKAVYYYMRGTFYHKMGEFEKAIEDNAIGKRIERSIQKEIR